MKTQARILLVGGGGREHALAWKIAQSPLVAGLWVAPGNPGTETLPKTHNVAIDTLDVEGLCAWVEREQIDLVVVGPEGPLAAGLADRLGECGVPCFGPVAASARLESSKAFAKEFMRRHGIATARSETVTDLVEGRRAARAFGLPVVLKADGLAAGKGVVIATNEAEVEATLEAMLVDGALGGAGRTVVVEEFLTGREVSIIAMVGRGEILALVPARDHKRRDEGDAGPNTGGMGAYSPVSDAPDVVGRALREVFEPAVRGLSQDGLSYTGFLYAGLMIEGDRLSVLEFNCRLGDPETQVILPRLTSDLVPLLWAAVEGGLRGATPVWDPRSAVTVVMAAAGYPADGPRGDVITGLGEGPSDVWVFQAGTRRVDNATVTAGGRVLAVTALGNDLAGARERAYQRVANLHFNGGFYRRDIGGTRGTR